MYSGTWIKAAFLSVLFLAAAGGHYAFAADGVEFTRATYDMIMRWVNFIILAAVLFKYGHRPIINFLIGQKNQVADTLKELEQKKQEAEDKIKTSQAQLAESKERLAHITERIKAEGKQRKQTIIEQAHEESRILMDSAKAKIEGHIREAFERIKMELVDAATDKAAEKLPALLQHEDHDALLQNWFKAASQ